MNANRHNRTAKLVLLIMLASVASVSASAVNLFNDTMDTAKFHVDIDNIAPWERGNATQVGGCYDDEYCWGTDLDSDYIASGPYVDTLTQTVSMNFTDYENITLTFFHYRDFEDATTIYDAGQLQVNDLGGWVSLPPLGGGGLTGAVANSVSAITLQDAFGNKNTSWEIARFNLSNYSGKDNVTIRFYFAADGATADGGWFVDNVSVEGDYNPDFESTPTTINLSAHLPGNDTEFTYTPNNVSVYITNNNSLPDEVWFQLNDNSNVTLNKTVEAWKAFRHDENHTGAADSYPVLTNDLFWKMPYSGTYDDFHSPAIYEDILYEGTKTTAGWARAVNATTGALFWEFYPNTECWDGCFYVTDERLFLGCRQPSVQNYVYALNRSTGVPLWNFSIASGTIRFSGSMVQDSAGRVFVCSWGATTNYLFALNGTDGAHLWNASYGSSDCVSSVAIAPDEDGYEVVYFGINTGSENVRAYYSNNGSHVWNYSASAIWDSSAVIYESFLYIASQAGDDLYAFNRSNGSLIWSSADGDYSTPTYHGGYVYMPDAGTLWKYNLTDTEGNPAAEEWSTSIGGSGDQYGSCAYAGGLMYCPAAVGGDDKIYAVNATDGSEVWNYQMGDNSFSSIAVVDGILYMASDDRYIHAIGDEKHFGYKTPITALDGAVNNITVYANNSHGNLTQTTLAFEVNAVPTVTTPAFNQSSASPGAAVRFNVSVEDASDVSAVIAEFEYPNGSRFNQTLSSSIGDATAENTTDREAGTAVAQGNITLYNISVDRACEDDDYTTMSSYDFISNWTLGGTGDRFLQKIGVYTHSDFASGEYMNITFNNATTNYQLAKFAGPYMEGNDLENYQWTDVNETIKINLGATYGFAIGSSADYTFERDGGSDCPTYLPNQGTGYVETPGTELANPFAPALVSSRHYGMWIVWYSNTTSQNDTNFTVQNYQDVSATPYSSVSNVSVRIEVDSYYPNISAEHNNVKPDLLLEVYNGSGWLEIGRFRINDTFKNNDLNTTKANFTLSTTESTILSSWTSTTNRDFRIRSVHMDFENRTRYDEINYSVAVAEVFYVEALPGSYYYDWSDTTNSGTYYARQVIANDSANRVNNYTTAESFTVTTVSGCPIAINTSTSMTSHFQVNLTAGQACVIINNDSLTFDCKGYSIGGNNSGFGINATGHTGVTIQNCHIANFTTHLLMRNNHKSFVLKNNFSNATSEDFYVHNSEGNVIANNSVKDSRHLGKGAVYLNQGGNHSVLGNTINISDGYGIYAYSLTGASDNNTITNNTVDIGDGGSSTYGIYFLQSTHNRVFYNSVVVTGSSSDEGLKITSSSDHNWIENNTVSSSGSSANNFGIRISQSDYNNITGNFIKTNGTGGNDGISIENSAMSNVICNNTIIANGSSSGNKGFDITTTVSNNNVSNNIIFTDGTSQNYGIGLESEVDNSTFANNVIRTFGSAGLNDGMRLSDSDFNNIMGNTIISNGSGDNNAGICFVDSETPYPVANNTIIAGGGGSFNHGIFLSRSENNNIFLANNISTVGGDSYAINIDRTNGSIFNQTILNNPVQWINATDNTLNNFTNTTFATPEGSIAITPLVQINNSFNVTREKLNITSNLAFLNSTNLTFFNTTAVIELYAVTFADPQPLADFEDDGSFSVCPSTICTELGFAGNIFVFNVSQFTGYKAGATAEYVDTLENHFIRVRILGPPAVGNPDLAINATGIKFNNSHPRENENITINATVCNIGTQAAGDFNVSFRDGNETGGTEISNDTISLSAGACAVVNDTYVSVIGNRTICVYADPADVISESSETNNFNCTQLNVQAYSFFYGKIKGNLTLNDLSNDTKYAWNHSRAGKVFFYDVDSRFNWSNLQALGKNRTNSTVSDDFTDANTNLNMTCFNDSIHLLWTTDGSTPAALRNFTVFDNPVNDVPVINSTNVSSFVTGILWDTADDTNGEYDTTDREDLVFIANINLSQSASSGNDIDYEARIPSLLRAYNDSADRIAYTAELR